MVPLSTEPHHNASEVIDAIELNNATCLHYGKGRQFEHCWYQLILILISIIGILGNIVNLIVLTRHRMLRHMDRLERSGTYGLIALAVSDLCFCLAQLPEGFYPSDYMGYLHHQRHILYGKIYGEALRDTFMTLSAWMIVIISVNRLIVVVYPLRARLVLTGVKTSVGIAVVTVMAVLLTLPSHLYLVIVKCVTEDGENAVELKQGLGGGESWAMWLTYRVRIWPVFATFIPFLVMLVCNTLLIVTLQFAPKDRKKLRIHVVSNKVSNRSNKITVTLLSVVLMFLVLVVPIEILLYRDIFTEHKWGHMVDKVFNILKVMNFSCNFLLYVMVNAKFRHILVSLVLKRNSINPASPTTKSELIFSRSSLGSPKISRERMTLSGSPIERQQRDLLISNDCARI